MAYALIHFLEGSEPRVTLFRPTQGEPTGDLGLMNIIGKFIHDWSTKIRNEGSPGAVRMAMLFVTEEQTEGREMRIVGGEGPLGISLEEIQALEGPGYSYEVSFGKPGGRELPTARVRPVEGSIRKG